MENRHADSHVLGIYRAYIVHVLGGFWRPTTALLKQVIIYIEIVM